MQQLSAGKVKLLDYNLKFMKFLAKFFTFICTVDFLSTGQISAECSVLHMKFPLRSKEGSSMGHRKKIRGGKSK